MNICIADLQKDLPLTHEKKKLERIVKATLEFLKQNFDEVSITFVSAQEMKKLHKQFFNDASLTDCISQPMDDANDTGYKVLGEIFVCPKAAINYAAQDDEDPYRETTLYVVHGLLHLLGYDDIKEGDRKKMRAKEKSCLDMLEKKKLLLKAPQKRTVAI
jgi:probable rRNA maturation factor